MWGGDFAAEKSVADRPGLEGTAREVPVARCLHSSEVNADSGKEETGNASVFKNFMKCSGRSAIPARTCKK